MYEQDQANFPLDTSEKIAKKLRSIARAILLILALLGIIFSLLSGASEAGGGISGMISNSPNAIPWVALFIVFFITLKWELLGGSLVVLMGILSIFFFDTFDRNSWPVLFIVSLPLLMIGGFLIGAWGLSKESK